MKNILLLFLLFATIVVKAQDTPLDEKEGVSLSYKIIKLKEDAKKDTYLITVKATNKSDSDLFYEASSNKVNPFFASATVRNGDTDIYITGLESKLYTANKALFYIKKGGSVSSDKEFKIAKGTLPVITSEFLTPLKNISEIR
ncbi:hypothetical protein H7F33_07170 [Pedobacter sp. PAMC26386]|nr:hypothetical protein H7F33_07170 [Pedobacter sp. PAMC26386]